MPKYLMVDHGGVLDGEISDAPGANDLVLQHYEWGGIQVLKNGVSIVRDLHALIDKYDYKLVFHSKNQEADQIRILDQLHSACAKKQIIFPEVHAMAVCDQSKYPNLETENANLEVENASLKTISSQYYIKIAGYFIDDKKETGKFYVRKVLAKLLNITPAKEHIVFDDGPPIVKKAIEDGYSAYLIGSDGKSLAEAIHEVLLVAVKEAEIKTLNTNESDIERNEQISYEQTDSMSFYSLLLMEEYDPTDIFKEIMSRYIAGKMPSRQVKDLVRNYPNREKIPFENLFKLDRPKAEFLKELKNSFVNCVNNSNFSAPTNGNFNSFVQDLDKIDIDRLGKDPQVEDRIIRHFILAHFTLQEKQDNEAIKTLHSIFESSFQESSFTQIKNTTRGNNVVLPTIETSQMSIEKQNNNQQVRSLELSYENRLHAGSVVSNGFFAKRDQKLDAEFCKFLVMTCKDKMEEFGNISPDEYWDKLDKDQQKYLLDQYAEQNRQPQKKYQKGCIIS